MMPWSPELEVALLGTLLIGGFKETAEQMSAEDFFRPHNRQVWNAMAFLHERYGHIDGRALAERLGAGFPQDYLIAVLEEGISEGQLDYLRSRVLDLSERRKTIQAAQSLAAKAADLNSGLEEVRAARSSVGEISGAMQAPFMDLADVQVRAERRRGVSTGFPSLDRLISTGGYPAGQMTVVSAYHKGGKTTFKLSSMMKQLEQEKRVLFATFADLGKQDIKERCLRNLCGWSRPPEHPDLKTMYNAALFSIDVDYNGNLYDASSLDSGDDIETFAAWFKTQNKKTPFDCVFVDYAQKITSSDKRAFNDLSMAATVSRKICRLAAQTNVPFVVGSQITEGNKKEGKKDMTKGSRVWEEDAGWVLRILPEKNIEIAYSRFGEQEVTVPMTWNRDRLRFEEFRS